MTISSTYEPVQYTGNGVTTVFAFPYPFFDNTDLIVYLDGVEQVSGFTITGGDGEDGDVTFSVAPASSVVVTIELLVPYVQEDHYVDGQAFPAATIEGGFDRAAVRDQQLNSGLTRSLKFPATVAGSIVGILPEPEDGKALIWSGTTGEVTNGPDAAAIAAAQQNAEDAETARIAAEAAQTAAEVAAAMLPLNNFTATSAPTVNDDSADGYSIGSRWIDTTGDLEAWVCANATVGAAQWLPTTLTVDDLGSLALLNDVAYANIASAALASAVSDLTSGTASKLVSAAIFKSWLDSKYSLVNPVTITTGVALAQDFTKPAAITPTRFRVNFIGFSTNGTSIPIIQLADAGGPETSGYNGTIATTSVTTGAAVGGTLAANVIYGTVYFELIDAANNTWSWSFVFSVPASPNTYVSSGTKSLSAALTGFRLTTVGGTDQADAGTIGIAWYG